MVGAYTLQCTHNLISHKDFPVLRMHVSRLAHYICVVGDGLAPVFFTLNANNQPAVRNPLTEAPNDQYVVSTILY